MGSLSLVPPGKPRVKGLCVLICGCVLILDCDKQLLLTHCVQPRGQRKARGRRPPPSPWRHRSRGLSGLGFCFQPHRAGGPEKDGRMEAAQAACLFVLEMLPEPRAGPGRGRCWGARPLRAQDCGPLLRTPRLSGRTCEAPCSVVSLAGLCRPNSSSPGRVCNRK